MKSSIIIICNPAARKISVKKIEQASRYLREKGFETEIKLTEGPGHAEQIARESLQKKPFLVLAAGGDGTINEVINGIIFSGIPVGILPLGTTNVLAKELSISENIQKALDVAVSKTPKTVSAGKIVLSSVEQDGKTKDVSRYFCLMAGIGFDGKAVYDINANLKRISGKGAYIVSGIRNFYDYHPNELFFSVDGKEFSGHSAIISKASRYGGNFRVAPDADIAAPCFYTCIFKGGRRRDLLRYVSGIVRGNHLKHSDIIYLQSRNIEIYGTAHIQIDGDYLGTTPARISVEKDALRLVY